VTPDGEIAGWALSGNLAVETMIEGTVYTLAFIKVQQLSTDGERGFDGEIF